MLSGKLGNLQGDSPTDNSLLFIHFPLFPVVKEAAISRNTMTAGEGLHCKNVKMTKNPGVLIECQWRQEEVLPTSAMFTCPVWKSGKPGQKGGANLAGKCSFVPCSQEGNSWGQATVCKPDSRRQKVEYKVNSQKRKKKCEGTLEKMSLVHNWTDRQCPFNHHRRATLPRRNVFALRGTRCHLVKSVFTGVVPWLSAQARDLENPHTVSEAHIPFLRLCVFVVFLVSSSFSYSF